jgi:hypothetical protein
VLELELRVLRTLARPFAAYRVERPQRRVEFANLHEIGGTIRLAFRTEDDLREFFQLSMEI